MHPTRQRCEARYGAKGPGIMVPIGAIEVPGSSVRQAVEDAREVGARDDAAPLDLKVRIK